MDIKTLQVKILSFIKKYRYVVLVLVVGLVLMMLPSMEKTEQTQIKTLSEPAADQQDLCQELEQILSQISGAGKVKVMLTVARGEQTIYQTNEDVSVSDASTTTRIDTITVTDSDRNQKGLISQVIAPTYLGAIVLCQGADSPIVKLAIVDAVSKITGLGADNISILKMK